jgi:hypothetical protein
MFRLEQAIIRPVTRTLKRKMKIASRCDITQGGCLTLKIGLLLLFREHTQMFKRHLFRQRFRDVKTLAMVS